MENIPYEKKKERGKKETFGVLGISDTDSTSDFNLPLHVSGSPIGSINNSGDPLGLFVEVVDSGVDELNLFTKGHFQPS